MAQIAKLEVQVDIKTSAQRFYETFRSKQNLFPRICPDLIKDIKVIKGDWESVGSIKQWTYVAGDSETSKESVESIDDANKTIIFRVVEGDATNYYKNLRLKVYVTGKGGGCSVKYTLEYQKVNDNIPAPTRYLDIVTVLSKKIEAYLNNN
ncbi:hypothetical protein TIFTF001_012940 [Ficus carica]|uniref:Bet v I/Major latex protein domain-containing protein n=1 Tax=Ficus carica TaxID=3494 RepID=A0AA88D2E3_FICCA|nr:hypothetical protein TIFTF001_012940 [Ficus carica]